MISLYTGKYTIADYEALYGTLCEFHCCHKGRCRTCPVKKACHDISRLKDHLEDLMDDKVIEDAIEEDMKNVRKN